MSRSVAVSTVRPLTAALMDEAHEARLALELHTAELTLGRLSEEELVAFRECMERTQAAVRGRRIVHAREYMLANKEFHEFQVDLARTHSSQRCTGAPASIS